MPDPQGGLGQWGEGGGVPTLGDPINKEIFYFPIFLLQLCFYTLIRGLFKKNGIESRKDALATGEKVKSSIMKDFIFVFTKDPMQQRDRDNETMKQNLSKGGKGQG